MLSLLPKCVLKDMKYLKRVSYKNEQYRIEKQMNNLEQYNSHQRNILYNIIL